MFNFNKAIVYFNLARLNLLHDSLRGNVVDFEHLRLVILLIKLSLEKKAAQARVFEVMDLAYQLT